MNLLPDHGQMNPLILLIFTLTAAVLMLETVPTLRAGEPSGSPPALAGWVARSWQTEDGLPQDSVNAITQTRDGFLWVGTSAGLARFDGVRFRTFGLQDGLRSVRITALAEDCEGALWAGTSGGGVSRWKNGRFTSFGVAEGFPSGGEAIALAAERDGPVWIGTARGLVRWHDGAFTMVGEAQGLPHKQVRALLLDSRGTLWVSLLADGLFRGHNGQFTREEGIGPEGGNVYSLMEDRDGAIWAGTNAVWKGSGGVWKRFDSADGLPKTVIQALAQSSDGTLWIGARNGGLYRLTGERFVRTADDGPLATQSVGAVMTDREGSVWAGAVSGGLHRLSPGVVQHWGADAGLAPTAVTSVVEDASGALFAGTANRGIFRFENGRFNALTDPVSAKDSIIYCTTATSDGGIWAGGEQCLFRFQPGQPVKAYLDPPVGGEAIRALCADGETLWLGTYYSALLKCDAGGVHVVAPGGSFPGTMTCIAREAADTLWIGTSGGLHLWNRGQVRTWTTRDGLPTDNIRALHRDPDGTLWIGTLGGGLVRMKDGRFVHITTRQGLIDDVISQIVQDDFGGLWLGCNRGIMRLARSELDALAEGRLSELHPAVFGRNEGMLKEQCFGGTSPTAFKTHDGRLFFPTMNGLAEVDPRRLQNIAGLAPQVIIDEILVDQRRPAADAELVIPPGKHRFEVRFTAPVLRGGEWLRFRHRLEGFDRDWSTAGRNRLASYDGLPPGRYVFHVAAADGKGNWHEPGAALEFCVLPFFWQTLWFRGGGLLLLAGASGTAAWWHLRRKHRRQLDELQHEHKLQAELAHANRVSTAGQLTAALAHELNQPLGIILSNAQAAQRMLQQEPPDLVELREILSDIVDEDRRAGEVIKRLRALLKRGETRLVPVSANEIIEDVLRLIRSELINRGVSVQTGLAAGLSEIEGDQVQLQQVLLNIIINACDAMAGNLPADRIIRISTIQQERMIRISIQDQGCGLPDGDATRIFQPFVTTKSQGMGMGLSICQSIIAAHHGRLLAEPHPEKGTTFHLELPVTPPPSL